MDLVWVPTTIEKKSLWYTTTLLNIGLLGMPGNTYKPRCHLTIMLYIEVNNMSDEWARVAS